MIYDIFTFNGEYDLLEIRLEILDKSVDQFIIVEATETFSGKEKPLYYEAQKDRYKKWHHKITYHVVRPPYKAEYVALADGSPNTRGAEHWKREFAQKESIRDAMRICGIKDEDICFIGDVDEIWETPPSDEAMAPEPTDHEKQTTYANGTAKIRLRVYTYYLNNRSSEDFYGTMVGKYKYIKGQCLNHLRSHRTTWTTNYRGWHFTSMGGYDEVKRKLSDSYTRESYWTPDVEAGLKDNVEKSQDFLGRGFTFKVDESDWPQYLKDNKQKYEHLLR